MGAETEMSKNTRLVIVSVVAVVLILAGWILWHFSLGGSHVKKVTAASAWEDVLRACAQNQTLRPENMVYLGPSNDLGVGTIWRKIDGRGYELKRLQPNALQ